MLVMDKRKERSDFGALTVIGLISMAIGVASDSPGLIALGIALLAVGWANGNKWPDQDDKAER
jgi:hypothetical protein